MSGFLYRPSRPEPALLRWLGDGLEIVIVVLGTALLTVMSANVLARAFFNADIAWNTEFGEFALVWATFLGGAAAARRGAHMCISEFVEKIPPTIRRIIEVTLRLAVMALLILLVNAGSNIVTKTMDQQMSVLYWPVGLQYLAMPVGSALTLVFVAYETWVIARGGDAFGRGQDITP
ncbi:MAG: TRAP transporter small permease subunit [Rhizobiales bacterium]|nr:TRAP transporter small permease subunit [Hyphomicrobiales bacterium]